MLCVLFFESLRRIDDEMRVQEVVERKCCQIHTQLIFC